MKNRKLLTEIGALAFVIVLIVLATTLKGGSKPSTINLPKVVPLKTSFDTDTLTQVQKRDANYTPVPLDDLGKADPYQ